MKGINMLVLRRVSTLLPLVTVLLCGLLTSDLAAEITPLPTGNDLEYTLETDKTIYQLGETVYATHTITNPLDVPVDVEFGKAPGFDLWVLENGERIWQQYRLFECVIWGRTFAPGEILVFDYTWDTTDYDGNAVLPGEYELVGVIYGHGRNVSTNITIVPEPASLILMLLGFGFVSARKRKRLCV